MKIKQFVFVAILSIFCAIGCSCEKEQPGGSSSSPILPPSSSDSVEDETVEGEPVISVNQSSVVLCIGDTFTLSAEAENIPTPVFVWMLDGDAADDVISFSQTGNTATITALKCGQTKLIATVDLDGSTYFKTVDITVKEAGDVSLVLSDNIGFNNDGYYVRLSTLSTQNGDVTSIVPIVTGYDNTTNKIIALNGFQWSSLDENIVALDGNKFVSVGEGVTKVVGSCEVKGKPYSVEVSVEVYRPTIRLEERFVVERESLTSMKISSAVMGVPKDVVYDGDSVGSFDTQSGVLTLEKSRLPKTAACMGENRALTIETSLASYTLSIDLYTKIIKTKDDFEKMSTLSKLAVDNAALWDGYFILGDDIAYNGLFQSKIADIDSLWAAVEGSWSNGGLYGFRGVFDGKGHTIEGVRIDGGSSMASIFGVLHIDGVIKNTSFTSASVAANSSFLCHAGGGTVENIYIQYDSVGQGAQHYELDSSVNNYCGSFFSFKEPTATANVSNCVIDVTQAIINEKVAVKLVGSEYVSIRNVFVIGGTDTIREKSNATLSFPTVNHFTENANAQGRYKKFNDEFWSKSGGVPIFNSVYEKVADSEVGFLQTPEFLVQGTSYQVSLSNQYVQLTSGNPNVAISGSVVTVLPTAQVGEKIKIVATSMFDSEKTKEFTATVSVADGACVDLTTDGETAFYDVTLGKVFFADLASRVQDEILYYVNADYSVATYPLDGDGAKTLYAVTKAKLYKFNCISVTKVIETAEDIAKYLRRDYTVESYGNKGCYDGLLTGTFVMVGDIDCTGLTLKNTGRYWENSRGFAGTLDGMGYTISNLSVGENGLFGVLSGATIKNVNFTNVKLLSADQGAYVSLFATRAFDTVIDNVSIQFTGYVSGVDVYHSSGLMFYETTFDCEFKNLTIDISMLTGVKYLTEAYYGADIPYRSEEKSVYENVAVIVATLSDVPVFAYLQAVGSYEDVVPYPASIIVRDVNGNVKE